MLQTMKVKIIYSQTENINKTNLDKYIQKFGGSGKVSFTGITSGEELK